MKRLLTAFTLSLVALGLVVVPFAQQASAATYYVIDPQFDACAQKLYTYSRWKRMQKDDCVRRIQQAMNEAKWVLGASGQPPANWPTMKTTNGQFDKKYGPQTRDAVKAYQLQKKNDGRPETDSGPVDGKVGPKTWASIRRDCVAYAERTNVNGQRPYHSSVCYKRVTN